MINDEYLIDVAKALNAESISNISHSTFGSTSMTITPTLTSIDNELSTRQTITRSRTDNVVSHVSLKSGASVTSPTGEYLYTSALFTALTGGIPRIAVSLPGLLQTTGFDIEGNWSITVSRS